MPPHFNRTILELLKLARNKNNKNMKKKSIIQPTISVKTTREPKGLKGVCCSTPSIKVDFHTVFKN